MTSTQTLCNEWALRNNSAFFSCHVTVLGGTKEVIISVAIYKVAYSSIQLIQLTIIVNNIRLFRNS